MTHNLRDQWLRAPARVIIAHHGEDGGAEGDVIAYAKETLSDGWNTWALVRGKLGKPRRVSSAYRRAQGRLRHVGDLHDDVLTPRIFAALNDKFTPGMRMELTAQVDLEEWLVIFGEPHQRWIEKQ